MKYKDWIETWLENYVKPSVKCRTYERYRELATLHVVKELGDFEMHELTAPILQLYTVHLLTAGNLKNGGGLETSTVNCIITVIQNSLKKAYAVGATDDYIGDKITRPSKKAGEVTCFSLEEQKNIEAEINSRRNLKMYGVIVCLYTGLRVGELLALEKTDVDVKKRTISVTKTCRDEKCGNKFMRRTDAPKTPSSVRLIPISMNLMPYIEALMENESNYLINSKVGKVLAVRSYQRSFELLLKRLDIKHRGFHTLRHTFATRAMECGVDVKTLAEILGHKNPMITLKCYAHSLDEHKNAMMNKVGALMDNV